MGKSVKPVTVNGDLLRVKVPLAGNHHQEEATVPFVLGLGLMSPVSSQSKATNPGFLQLVVTLECGAASFPTARAETYHGHWRALKPSFSGLSLCSCMAGAIR